MAQVLAVVFFACVLLMLMPAPQGPSPRKQVVAHRGASAYAPEHTLAAYRLALEQGADFVEQDLAVTRDGVLVCIHDLSLERTTDVAERFPDRFIRVGPTRARRWLVGDFTLAEIKRLDAGSRFDRRFAGETVPTFQEAVDLVKGKAGLYPELKDPAFYRERGVEPAALLAEALRKNGLPNDPATPVIVQSFDDATLKQVATLMPGIPRVILVENRDRGRLDSPDKIREIATWATGLGPNKAIVERLPQLVRWAHAANLTVTPWTFRSSKPGDAGLGKEMARFLYEYGVDALFTDNPDLFPRKEP
jgi:glycerophosphoryl diester phosphodiesterase